MKFPGRLATALDQYVSMRPCT